MSKVTTACRDISELTPNAQIACNLFLDECQNQGLNVLITETYRSQARQDYLYAQGRTRSGKKVTWTRNSRHTSRRAWDICKNVKGQEYSDTLFFKKCGEIAKKIGIIWGGDWSTPDMPHFEISEDWSYEGDEPMTTQERKKFNQLVEVVERLQTTVDKLANPMIYNYIDKNMPEWAKPTIQKLVNKGIIKGDENGLGLTYSDLKHLVWNDRAGLYD